VAGALAAALVAGGAFLSYGPPRLVALNAALRVEYAWPRVLGAATVAAGGLVLLAAGRRRWLWALSAVLFAGGLAAGLHLLRYRVEADDGGLSARALLGTSRLGWTEVERVETGPGLLVVTGRGRTVRVDTTDFRPEQRAALERTVARRLRGPLD
jgi:hypothetical protein